MYSCVSKVQYMNVLANSIDAPLKIYRKQSLNNLESIEYVSECVIIKIIINLLWVVPEKIHTPLTDGILEILTGGGLKDPGNPGRRRGGVKLEKVFCRGYCDR